MSLFALKLGYMYIDLCTYWRSTNVFVIQLAVQLIYKMMTAVNYNK